MKGIELYINRQLCDIGSEKEFSIYLKRQFINPGELSAKDAQRSYDITLPASPVNNAIFGYILTEEVKGKFSTLYDASLIMGGVKIFEGKFKLSEITPTQYKGNLGIPYTKTIKDIFGSKNMNEIGKWTIDFNKIEDFTVYNNQKDLDYFFPMVMYGLLPKVPQKNGNYSAKSVIDDTVRFGLEDFPPSINCLEAIKRIFQAQNIELTGSAFSDKRLKRLFMSYKNPADYPMPWPYGNFAKIHFKGSWDNCQFIDKDKGNVYKSPKLFEMNTFVSRSDVDQDVYTCNLLSSTNLTDFQYLEDNGNNISFYEKDRPNYIVVNEQEKITRKEKNYSIVIPFSGYYRVTLNGSIRLPRHSIDGKKQYQRFTEIDPNTHIQFHSPDYNEGKDEYLNDKRYELKLMRDRGENRFDLEGVSIDGTYYEKNQQQKRSELGGDYSNPKPAENSFYPPVHKPTYTDVKDFKPNQTVFVDPAQNPNIIIGLSWGVWEEGRDQTATPLDPFLGKRDYEDRTRNAVWARTLAAKSCYSWDNDLKDSPLSRVIVNNPDGYWKYSSEAEEEVIEGDENKGEALGLNTRADQLIPRHQVNRHRMILNNSPQNYARRGFHKGEAKPIVSTTDQYNKPLNWYGDGEMNAIVWFEKGEHITLVSSSDRATNEGWIWHILDFELSIEPYHTNKGWAKINEYTGQLLQDVAWKEEMPDKYKFRSGNVDLMKFLPSNVKVDDWMSNFCKAFNLELTQSGKDKFELNLKKGLNWNTSLIIDLDNRANVTANRQNTPFNLPAAYEIGFTVDKDEIGYVNSTIRYENGEPIEDEQGNIKVFEGDDGGGRFETGSTEKNIVNQTSNFSYNWMKTMKKSTDKGDSKFYETGTFPIISDKEVWEGDNSDYANMMMKDYRDKPQRFWYKADENYKVKINNRVEIEAALVSNSYEDTQSMVLNYKNVSDSILRNYFTILTDAQNCFTTVECHLTPEEYSDIEYSLILFNGDLYYVAEIDGYDPLGIKKATLKLIRKIL